MTSEKMAGVQTHRGDTVGRQDADTPDAGKALAGKASMSDDAFEAIAQRFRLLAEPTRLKILFFLNEAELSVGELVSRTGGTQSNVSKHLSALYSQGLVHRRRQGTSVLYSVADASIFQLCEIVCGGIGRALDDRRNALP
jgi:DNA-binding transcriptional ArsR family regulator